MQKDDEQIIADCLDGDDKSFALIVDRYLKQVFNFTCRLVGKPEDAEDIVQDAFLKVWRNIKKYRKGENFKTWLFAIARNTAIDWMRKKKSVNFSVFENEEGENPFEETLADLEPLPEEIFAKAEEKAFLEDVLMKLPLPKREILLLHYNEHLTFDEISKMIGQPLNTVKSRHRRALIELRKLFVANAPK